MTDAAVVADPGPAPSDVGGAPINETPTNFNAPLGSQIPPDAQAKPDAKPASLDDSIDRAIAKSAAKQAAPKEDVKADAKAAEPVKEAPLRGDGGKFAAKQPAEGQPAAQDAPQAKPVAEPQAKPTSFHEAPKRFSEEAKASWQTAPEPVRAEIHRAVKELETGISQYREFVEPLKPYAQLAQQHNTTIDKALGQYINLERSLKSSDPAQKNAALNDVFQAAGVNPRDWAAQILNQTPDQAQSQQDSTIRELRQQIAGLQQQIGGVTQTFQQQREQSTLQQINDFASKPENARFEELADDIAFFMQSGRAKDLPEAYQLAERLNPAPAKAPALAASSAAPATQDPPVHPDKGQKSINGAPSAGLTSQPGKKRATRSLDEALDRAFGQAG